MKPDFEVLEVGTTELIDKDDAAIAASAYTKSVSVTLESDLSGGGGVSGEILSFQMTSLEIGTGAIIYPACTVFFFDADPAIAAADTAMVAAGVEHKSVIGMIEILAGDWNVDTTGAVVFKAVSIPFHKLKTIYVAAKLAAGSTTVNSAAGDDEEFWFNIWYRRES